RLGLDTENEHDDQSRTQWDVAGATTLVLVVAVHDSPLLNHVHDTGGIHDTSGLIDKCLIELVISDERDVLVDLSHEWIPPFGVVAIGCSCSVIYSVRKRYGVVDGSCRHRNGDDMSGNAEGRTVQRMR